MISPVTVTILPGTGFLSTAAAIVVVVQGSVGLSPNVPAGLSNDPASGATVISGCKTAPAFAGAAFFGGSCAIKVTPIAATQHKIDFVNLYISFPPFVVFVFHQPRTLAAGIFRIRSSISARLSL